MESNIDEFIEVGQENENDIHYNDISIFSQAVLWSTDWTTETILNQLKRGNIELNPKFQRRDAWTEVRKSSFIESIILGLPIPQIILAERKDKKGSYIVIDGKQRLLSIRQFCASKDDSDFNILKLKELNMLPFLNQKSYEDIKIEQDLFESLNAFENQPIRTMVIRNWPNDDFLFTVFLRLNTGSLPLSPQELRQALNPGEFINFADEFSANSKALQEVLGNKKPDFRMRDIELAIRYFGFVNFLEEYKGNLKDFLDRTCKILNNSWNKSMDKIMTQGEALEKSINTTFEIFGHKHAFSKWTNNKFLPSFNRPVFDIMTFYFSDEKISKKALESKKEIVEAFKTLCDNNIDFLRSLETSTKTMENTVKRLKIWGEAISKITKITVKTPEIIEGKIKLK
jgi:hypothetical protein